MVILFHMWQRQIDNVHATCFPCLNLIVHLQQKGFLMIKLCFSICNNANVPHHCEWYSWPIQRMKAVCPARKCLEHLENRFKSSIPHQWSIIGGLEGFSKKNNILYSRSLRNTVEIIWYEDFKEQTLDLNHAIHIWGNIMKTFWTYSWSKTSIFWTIPKNGWPSFWWSSVDGAWYKEHTRNADQLLEMKIFCTWGCDSFIVTKLLLMWWYQRAWAWLEPMSFACIIFYEECW